MPCHDLRIFGRVFWKKYFGWVENLGNYQRLKIKFLEGFLFPVFISVFEGISQKVATSILGIRVICYREKLER